MAFEFLDKNPYGRRISTYISGRSAPSAGHGRLSKHADINAANDEPCLDVFWSTIRDGLNSPGFMLASVIVTVVALLAYDFHTAFLPRSLDKTTEVVIVCVFMFFVSELLLCSIFREKYFPSFWFWLDLVAAVSMLPDMPIVLGWMGLSPNDVGVANANAGKAGKSARSSVAFRALRMLRFSRMFRIVRLMRIFRSVDDHDTDAEEEDQVRNGTTKIGRDLSDSMTKTIIGFIMLMMLVMPWLDPVVPDRGASKNQGLELLDLNPNSPNITKAVKLYAENSGEILYLSVAGQRHIDKSGKIASRRPNELFKTTSASGNSRVTFDARQQVYMEAVLGLAATFTAILIFSLSSLTINTLALNMVVDPIRRMTHVMLKMAGTIGMLGGPDQVESLQRHGNELDLVQKCVERIADIFEPQSGATYQNTKGFDLLRSKKTTAIRNNDRILQVSVEEMPRTSYINSKVEKAFKDFSKHGTVLDEEQKDVAQLAELSSLKAVMSHPGALHCFNKYLTSTLCVENWKFWEHASAFEKYVQAEFRQIYKRYISPESPIQVNLPADLFTKLRDIHEGKNKVSADSYIDSAREIWKLLDVSVYPNFLKSPFAKFYAHMKKTGQLGNFVQLRIPVQNENTMTHVADEEDGIGRGSVPLVSIRSQRSSPNRSGNKSRCSESHSPEMERLLVSDGDSSAHSGKDE